MTIEFLSDSNPISISFINLKCPHCGHIGTFSPINNYIQSRGGLNYFGVVACPNVNCKCLSFVILDQSSKVVKVYPEVMIDFDRSKIPLKIITVFEESLKSYSVGCFIASAIMLRKTLEVITEDKGAKGKTLKEKINDLGGKIMIPKELLAGMDELRLFGNDAAHVEAKIFEEIGQTEVEISIEFTKEILKAVYQYEDLLEKLRSLKKKI